MSRASHEDRYRTWAALLDWCVEDPQRVERLKLEETRAQIRAAMKTLKPGPQSQAKFQSLDRLLDLCDSLLG